jgi:hypothetical protein
MIKRYALLLCTASSVCLIGCGIQYKDRNIARPVTAGHPVVVTLGFAPKGPAALAFYSNTLAVAWPDTKNTLLIAADVFARAHGPCGAPNAESYTEQGRPRVSISCDVKAARGWKYNTLHVGRVRLVASAIANRWLYICLVKKRSIEIDMLAMRTLKVRKRWNLATTGVTAVAMAVAVGRKAPLIGVVETHAHTGTLKLFIASRGHWRNLNQRSVTPFSPIALEPNGRLYIFAFTNAQRRLSMERLNGPSSSSEIATFPVRADSIAMSVRSPEEYWLAYTGDNRKGHGSVFSVDTIRYGRVRMRTSKNELRAKPVLIGSLGAITSIVVRAKGYGLRSLASREQVHSSQYFWSTVTWDKRKRIWMTTRIGTSSDAVAGEASGGELALLTTQTSRSETRMFYSLVVLTP